METENEIVLPARVYRVGSQRIKGRRRGNGNGRMELPARYRVGGRVKP
jgi:hypothetical protein